ncbi:hypothetical protein [Streptomyces pini]|uniref:Uncharacterized protein n=1 Tax=Streptomyces pini TaxID=1520580 RepID=A0A1I4C141_9ACTN|nr:hypothetical protein [Streptomyces pini]SFK74483.1 hypothetical protein SAMN05192584_108207 [Streptomyces pini]
MTDPLTTIGQQLTRIADVLTSPEPPATDAPVEEPATAGPDELRLLRVVEHALGKPVPCPSCERRGPCQCGRSRDAQRAVVVVDALAPWLRGSDDRVQRAVDYVRRLDDTVDRDRLVAILTGRDEAESRQGARR